MNTKKVLTIFLLILTLALGSGAVYLGIKLSNEKAPTNDDTSVDDCNTYDVPIGGSCSTTDNCNTCASGLCTSCEVCGGEVCVPEISDAGCDAACGGACGNGDCKNGETCTSCPQDCGQCPNTTVCDPSSHSDCIGKTPPYYYITGGSCMQCTFISGTSCSRTFTNSSNCNLPVCNNNTVCNTGENHSNCPNDCPETPAPTGCEPSSYNSGLTCYTVTSGTCNGYVNRRFHRRMTGPNDPCFTSDDGSDSAVVFGQQVCATPAPCECQQVDLVAPSEDWTGAVKAGNWQSSCVTITTVTCYRCTPSLTDGDDCSTTTTTSSTCSTGWSTNPNCAQTAGGACPHEAPNCGNGTIDAGEECGEPGLTCPGLSTCIEEACLCEPASFPLPHTALFGDKKDQILVGLLAIMIGLLAYRIDFFLRGIRNFWFKLEHTSLAHVLSPFSRGASEEVFSRRKRKFEEKITGFKK